MEIKDKIEILNKQIASLDKEANIIYKKLFVLIASEAWIGSLLLKIENNLFFIFISIIFSILFLAIFANYSRLGFLRENVNKINVQIKKEVTNAFK